RCLCALHIKLLGESTNRNCPFILGNLHAQTRLALTAASRSPIKNRNRKADCGGHTAVLFQSRTLHRVCIESAVHRIRQRRQTIRPRNLYFLDSGTQLMLELRELRTLGNVLRFELLVLSISWKSQREIGSADWPRKIIADEHAQ